MSTPDSASRDGSQFDLKLDAEALAVALDRAALAELRRS
jgi:hypothetical protein